MCNACVSTVVGRDYCMWGDRRNRGSACETHQWSSVCTPVQSVWNFIQSSYSYQAQRVNRRTIRLPFSIGLWHGPFLHCSENQWERAISFVEISEISPLLVWIWHSPLWNGRFHRVQTFLWRHNSIKPPFDDFPNVSFWRLEQYTSEEHDFAFSMLFIQRIGGTTHSYRLGDRHKILVWIWFAFKKEKERENGFSRLFSSCYTTQS